MSYPKSAATVVFVEDPASVLPTVVSMYDSVVEWLVSQGRTGQWGTKSKSTDEAFVQFLRGLLKSSDVYRVVDNTWRTLGIIAINGNRPHPETIPPPAEPELYIQFLISERNTPIKGLGQMLVQRAKDEAVKRGIRLLRVDCYAGGDGRLVALYERMGFKRAPEEMLYIGNSKRPMQVLEMRLGN